ncbi:MAG TPA: LON peptidase substrate-binding domain-containing protein, partial [Thermoanaerobaculia bacterium]|nr:LON peptidase substrate-binding domain-containing protein [Thermoanaerobaculia bacterium]
LLLPGNFLPLNIYERRYRNLIEDIDRDQGCLGMVQPFEPRQDNLAVCEEDEAVTPRLYDIGCVGRLDRCERQADGRYLVVLRGLCRFRIERELESRRGYRRVEADLESFAEDLEESRRHLSPARLLAALERFSDEYDLDFDFDMLRALPGVSLVNGLATALPFSPAEKQALLEAADAGEREQLLLTLLDMGFDELSVARFATPPSVH